MARATALAGAGLTPDGKVSPGHSVRIPIDIRQVTCGLLELSSDPTVRTRVSGVTDRDTSGGIVGDHVVIVKRSQLQRLRDDTCPWVSGLIDLRLDDIDFGRCAAL